MPLTIIQKQTLAAAQAAFMHQTGLMLDTVRNGQNKPFLLIKAPVATAELELIVNGHALAVNELLLLCNRLGNLDQVVMVIPQATADQADRFRELGIQFIDTAGNGYINQPPLYLFIKGNKAQSIAKVPQVNRVFKPPVELQNQFALIVQKVQEKNEALITSSGLAGNLFESLYGDYVDGLENEYEEILKYMGREFVQVKVRGERYMLSSPVMTGLETFSGNTFGESSGESQKQNPVYPIEYTGQFLAER